MTDQALTRPHLGLALTAVSSNPKDASTLWLNSGDSRLYFGANQLAVAGDLGTMAAETAADYYTAAQVDAGFQPLDAGLTSIAGLATVSDKMLYTTASDTYATTTLSTLGRTLLGNSTAADMRSTLGSVIGTDVQAYDAGLASIAGLVTTADRLIYTTASNTYTTATLTSFARTLLDDVNASAARATLGLAIGSDVQAYDAGLTSIASLSVASGRMLYTSGTNTYTSTSLTAFARTLLDDSSAAEVRTTLGLVIGTDVQAYDDDLTAVAGLASSGFAVRVSPGSWVQRNIVGTANEIAVTNQSGTAGNPTISLPASLSFAGKTITNLGSVTNCDINGGNIDGTAIGASSAAAATVTTLTASENAIIEGSVRSDTGFIWKSSTNTSTRILTANGSSSTLLQSGGAANYLQFLTSSSTGLGYIGSSAVDTMSIYDASLAVLATFSTAGLALAAGKSLTTDMIEAVGSTVT